MKKICIIFTIMCILMTGCSTKKETDIPELLETASVNIETAQVKKGDIYDVSTYYAQIVPYTKELSFSISGYIKDFNVALGDTVNKGQVLMTMDNGDLKLQIEDLENTIAVMKKEYEYNNTSLECDLTILELELDQLKEKMYSETDQKKIEDLQKAIKVKKADIDIANLKITQTIELQDYELKEKVKELEKLSPKDGKNEIRAPFSGTITYLAKITNKDMVNANQVVIVIADLNHITLQSDFIKENIINSCDRYFAKINNVEYEITYEPMDKKEYSKLQSSGSKVTSIFKIKGPKTDIQMGDAASIYVVNNYVKNTLYVPIQAIYRNSTVDYVYLMNGDVKERKSISIGVTTNIFAEIRDGLEEGDEIYVQN